MDYILLFIACTTGILLAPGLSLILAKDFWWEFVLAQARIWGRPTEELYRTSSWETQMNVVGIIDIVISIIFAIWMLSQLPD